jgi:hemolysin activation/secretion protein
VRGYLESERLGDDGWQATVEWRSPAYGVAKWRWLTQWQVLIFSDAARLRVQQPLPDQTARFKLTSVGLGAHFTAWKNLKGDMDWAYALEDGAATYAGDYRVHFRLAYEF